MNENVLYGMKRIESISFNSLKIIDQHSNDNRVLFVCLFYLSKTTQIDQELIKHLIFVRNSGSEFTI